MSKLVFSDGLGQVLTMLPPKHVPPTRLQHKSTKNSQSLFDLDLSHFGMGVAPGSGLSGLGCRNLVFLMVWVRY